MSHLLRRLQRSRTMRLGNSSAEATPPPRIDVEHRDPPLLRADAEAYRLRRFDPRLAGLLVSWVNTARVLRWLAPSVVPPLTADTVRSWHHPDGQSLCLASSPPTRLLAYGELNPMRNQAEHYWLGHILVDPAKRGYGIGTRFVRAIQTHAYEVLGALQLTLVVFPDNETAVRCYRRTGFRDVGEEDHRFTPTGPSFRLLRMTLSRREWAERNLDSSG